MILSIIKKAIAIYFRISSLLFLSLISQSFAAEDLASFCFDSKTNLSEARDSLSFLLLPREKVFLRPSDHCFDVNTSTDRSKLLEKFLSKRYTLVMEPQEIKKPINFEEQQCRIELTTTRNKEVKTQRIGVTEIKTVQELSTAKLLLGFGTPGTLELEGSSLNVECVRGATGAYQLTFSYSELYKSKVSSVVSLKQGEPLEVGGVVRDLNEKSKAFGIQYKEVEGQDKIRYELKVN